MSPHGDPECQLHCRPHERSWVSPLTTLSHHQGLEPRGAMHWTWAAAAVALWLQLTLLGGVGARREPKRPRPPSQRTEPPTATTSNSEGLLGSPEVCTGRSHVGAGVCVLVGFGRPPGSRLPSSLQALPCPALQPPHPFSVEWGLGQDLLVGQPLGPGAQGKGGGRGGASRRGCSEPFEASGPTCR